MKNKDNWKISSFRLAANGQLYSSTSLARSTSINRLVNQIGHRNLFRIDLVRRCPIGQCFLVVHPPISFLHRIFHWRKSNLNHGNDFLKCEDNLEIKSIIQYLFLGQKTTTHQNISKQWTIQRCSQRSFSIRWNFSVKPPRIPSTHTLEYRFFRTSFVPSPIQTHIDRLYEQVDELMVQLTEERFRHQQTRTKVFQTFFFI